MQLCHVMKPNKDVALQARMMWQLYLQGTQMVLQRLYMLSCSITHSLDYMAQIHARQTMTESTSELCWSLTPDCDNATVSCYYET